MEQFPVVLSLPYNGPPATPSAPSSRHLPQRVVRAAHATSRRQSPPEVDGPHGSAITDAAVSVRRAPCARRGIGCYLENPVGAAGVRRMCPPRIVHSSLLGLHQSSRNSRPACRVCRHTRVQLRIIPSRCCADIPGAGHSIFPADWCDPTTAFAFGNWVPRHSSRNHRQDLHRQGCIIRRPETHIQQTSRVRHTTNFEGLARTHFRVASEELRKDRCATSPRATTENWARDEHHRHVTDGCLPVT